MNTFSEPFIIQHHFSFCDNPLLLYSETCILREIHLTRTSNMFLVCLVYQTAFFLKELDCSVVCSEVFFPFGNRLSYSLYEELFSKGYLILIKRSVFTYLKCSLNGKAVFFVVT